MNAQKFGRGQPHTRLEDPALLAGLGTYVADAAARAQALAALVVRAPHAHARFEISGLEDLRARAGVHLVLTAQDIADFGPLPIAANVAVEGEARMWRSHRPVLADGVARYLGEAVALIVADTLDLARDAAEAMEIAWDPLDAAVDLEAATDPDAPLVWSERPQNLAFTSVIGDERAAAEAFAAADRVVRIRLVNNRVVTNYLEPRGVLGEVEEGGRVRLTLGSQGSHL
ncbi:MAG: hypothetical protein B7Z45_09030, partial [Azorhizobium sp. 12-66-6]